MAITKTKKQDEAATGAESSVGETAKHEGATEVTVVIRKNIPTGPATGTKRNFSESVHGEDFVKVAQAYAERFGGEIL